MGGFLSLLTVLFVGLKLLEIINWSWWLVFSPLLGGLIFSVLCVVFYLSLIVKMGENK